MSTRPEEVNPYRPPQAALAEPDRLDEALFYVVAPTKFLLLAIGTLGLYQVYWFYKNWALLNVKHKSYWPVLRAIFAIFFVYQLFHEIDDELGKRSGAARHDWSFGLFAWIYIVTAIVSQVFGRLASKAMQGPAYIVSLVALFVMIAVLFQAQKAINLASGDPDGQANARITGANIAWLAVGALLWLANLAGIWMMLTGRPLQ